MGRDRKDDYRRLKNVGYTAKEATKYSSRKDEVVNQLIGLKQIENLPTYHKGESKDDRNLRLREVNRILKGFGVPTADRSRLRNASKGVLKEIISTGITPEIKGSLSYKDNPPKNFTQRFNAVVEITFINESTGEEKIDTITIQANWKLTRKAVDESVIDIVASMAKHKHEGSNWKYVRHQILGAWENKIRPLRKKPDNFDKYKNWDEKREHLRVEKAKDYKKDSKGR